ncbi:hypothetical protein [Pseudomonas syringae group genomosp. 7]|uniref:hypothetical protein n=1 Tax=Pseudomonas syringae group genomosp. 7 TaxID=251699 RepID=UPI001F4BF6FB|nr:hypothetical protein [Pseudomonas syringae group genomosp. 7]UNB66155.1 hypothetical protein MME54_28500 [Pseudomonas syringae pv. helianthi]
MGNEVLQFVQERVYGQFTGLDHLLLFMPGAVMSARGRNRGTRGDEFSPQLGGDQFFFSTA